MPCLGEEKRRTRKRRKGVFCQGEKKEARQKGAGDFSVRGAEVEKRNMNAERACGSKKLQKCKEEEKIHQRGGGKEIILCSSTKSGAYPEKEL